MKTNQNADQILDEVMRDAKLELASLVKEEVREVVRERQLRKGAPGEPPASGAGPVPPEESPAGPGEGPGDPIGGEPDGDEGMPPGGPEDGGGAPDVDEIVQQALQMPPEVVAVYAQAFQEALAQMQGGPGGPGGGEGSPAPGPSAPPSEETAAKSEVARLGAALRKSQAQIDELTAKVARLGARPRQSAVTDPTGLAKREPQKPQLTRDDINQKLLAKSSKPDTSLADRRRINNYMINNLGVDTIADLLQ